MPGVVGNVGLPGSGAAEQRFARMLRPMERGGRTVRETRINPREGWALGRVHLGVLHPEAQLEGDSPIQVLFHGDLFNESELAALLGEASSQGTAAIVAALYRRFGPSLASHLKGSFCAAILDENAKQLLLINDRLGSYPLYWFHAPEVFAFASELRALVPVHPKPALNPRAVNDLITFGFPLGDKTLAAGIQLLPSESILTYCWETAKVSIEQYASWVPAFRPSGIAKPQYLEDLGRAFDVSMTRSVSGSHRYGLSLSGGLDTRVLLSALDRMGVPLSTFTLGGRGCADEVIGYQLAKMSRSHHRFVPLEEGYLAELLPMAQKMVSLTDGMYTSHGFTEVLALKAFEESDLSVLLRGHAGELAKASTAWPLHTDAQVFGMNSPDQLAPYLLSRLESLNHRHSAAGLFTDAWAEASDEEGARRSLNESVAGIDLSPPDLCSYIYLHEYHRRVTVPSLEIFRNVVEVRLPLADVDFIECVFQGQPTWRDGVGIHQSLVARNNPAYLKVRNPNTGAPAGAGPLQEFILDKVNSLFRRLNVHGYRHYHAFDGWMRGMFLQMARQVLLDPDTLARGVVREQALRQQIGAAQAGDTTPDHVLQVLVLVELWQRENL